MSKPRLDCWEVRDMEQVSHPNQCKGPEDYGSLTCMKSSREARQGRVVTKPAGKEARSLVSHDEDFLFHSKYVIAMNEQKSKQMNAGVNAQPEKSKGHSS